MPSGKTHYELWKVGWTIVPAVFMACPTNWSAVGSIIGYGLIGQFVDPDLDLVGITSAEGRMMRKLPLIGGLFVAYWTFYGFLFRGKHRSFWTHSLFVSTAIRFLYMFWFFWYLGWWSPWLVEFMTGVYFGMSTSDAIHSIADWRIKNERV